MRRILLPVLVLVAAGGAWALLGGGGDGADDAASVQREVEDETPEDLVTLRGRGDAATGDRMSEAAEEEPEPTPASVPGYVVRGEVRTSDGSWAADAEVTALAVAGLWARETEAPPATVVRPDGRFELDVTDLFAEEAESVTHLEIRVTHPYYVAATKRIDVTAARTQGERVFEVALTLRPGYSIAGAVHDAGGQAFREAQVAVFESGPQGPLVKSVVPVQPLVKATPDEEGRFHVQVPRPGRYLVVAAAKGFKPAGVHVDVDAPVRLAPLVVRPGVAIEGRAVYASAPAPDVWLRAETPRDDGALLLDCGGPRVYWRQGDEPSPEAWSRTDEQGRFRLAGLEAGAHELRFSGFGLPGVPTVCHLVSQSLTRTVTAPADGVVIEIEGVVAEIRVLSSEEPVPEALVRFETETSSCQGRTDEHGVVRALLAPATGYEIGIAHDAYEEARSEIDTAAVGSRLEHVVALVPAPSKPTLVLTFAGPGAKTLDRAAVTLRNLSNPGVMRIQHQASGMAGSATYRWSGAPPGRYELTVAPGAGLWDQSGYHQVEKREVRVPLEGEVHVAIALRMGGRLRIAARDEAGALIGAFCTLRDGRGEKQEVSFTSHGDSVVTTNMATLGSLSPSTVNPPLPPGTYTIELQQDGYEPQTVEAVVKEGETTDVEVKLAAR